MALTAKQIDNRFAKREKLLAQIEDLKKQVAAIDDEMKEECDRLGLSLLLGDKSQVRYAEVVKPSFDSSRFKADHAALYQAYQVDKKTRPFYFEKLSAKNAKMAQAAKAAAAAERAAAAADLAPVPVAV